MRLLVTGKTRSGKSTALHRILSHALRLSWAGVLFLDSKGSELCAYSNASDVTYVGPDRVDAWADKLEVLANALPARYADSHTYADAHHHRRPHPPRAQPRLRDPGEGG
jgi:hypothetical protein